MSRALLEHEAREALSAYGIQNVPGEFNVDKSSAIACANKIGYPVVLKIVSPDIVHKSDAGGVKVNLKNDEELSAAYDAMMDSCKAYAPNADIKGVLVTKMIFGAREVIVGALDDSQFGSVIMVGLGGIFVEVFKDLSFGIAPVSEKEAEKMVKSLKSIKILNGTRGDKPIDFKSLYKLIASVSEYAYKEGVQELDLNPVFCLEDAVYVGDARILLK